MSQAPHVAILIETSLAYGRGLLRGVARYVHERGPWSVFFQPQGLEASPPPWLGKWQGQGILVRINNRRMANAVLRTRLPAVDVRNALADVGLPGIGPDNQRVARLIFQHFFDIGIRRFGFCAAPRGENRFLDARADAFFQLVENAGYRCEVYRPPAGRRADWERGQARLAQWLKRLPKPAGIMACDDDRGLQVLDACLRAGLRVPDELAVIGVNNDEHLCGLANPAMSSVDVGAERIGYEAAALLDRLMAGEKPPRETLELPPRGLVARRSSDWVSCEDRLVSAALELIRQRACDGVDTVALAEAVYLSRSTLERRFLRQIGRTPKQEILRVRLARAKELLLYTELSLAAVAERTGFRSSSYFCEVFHQETGVTPGAFRREQGVARFVASD